MSTPHAALLDYFDRLQIINLPARADRREETDAEFAAHGWPSPGVRGQFFPAISPEDAAGFPNRGVRGCFLSHLAILRAARDAGVERLLILEDDVCFVRDIRTLGAEAVARLAEAPWDIAYLGHALASEPGALRWQSVRQPMLLAHCYAVNGRILADLVAFLEAILERPPGHPDGGPMHYDGALNTFIQNRPQCQARYCSKNLAYQRPSRTDLHQTSIIDRHPLLRPFATLVRALKRRWLKWRS